MIFGKSVSFLYHKDEEKATFNFKIKGTLSERIKDTEFMLALLKSKHYKLDGDNSHYFNFKVFEEAFDFNERIEFHINYLNCLMEERAQAMREAGIFDSKAVRQEDVSNIVSKK